MARRNARSLDSCQKPSVGMTAIGELAVMLKLMATVQLMARS